MVCGLPIFAPFAARSAFRHDDKSHFIRPFAGDYFRLSELRSVSLSGVLSSVSYLFGGHRRQPGTPSGRRGFDIWGIRTGAGVNEAPGAPQSRDPGSAAAEVESHPVRHTNNLCPTGRGLFAYKRVGFEPRALGNSPDLMWTSLNNISFIHTKTPTHFLMDRCLSA